MAGSVISNRSAKIPSRDRYLDGISFGEHPGRAIAAQKQLYN
jgi:hypothetical protein